ncbi:20137_t:CDS:2 [Dentiscutata erythropus]|uniref:20137_t:CDS:1 n=1 Tax=Dentiscutata erythropus TaxID=1348616 RepID=A0A9N9GWF9_9GLOM|nr:20137_t:CDS:2 [Dentiscutata erythropus]
MSEKRQPIPKHIKEKYKTSPFTVIKTQLKPPPPAIEILLIEEDPKSNKPFVFKIIVYNQIFAFILIGDTILDKKLANAKKGVYTYKIRG